MNKKILVTYASRAGSTAEVAQAIGDTLSKSGASVDVLPMQEVQQLSSYQAVIAGSPIRRSKWLPEAIKFIEDHRTELRRYAQIAPDCGAWHLSQRRSPRLESHT